jgi:hypothetical protein
MKNTLIKILLSLGLGVTVISLIANAIELVILSFIVISIIYLGWVWIEGGKELRKK